jgi:hypothetical protein
MEEILKEIIHLAYQINERKRPIYVGFDYDKGPGAVVAIHDCDKDTSKVYVSRVHGTDWTSIGGEEWMVRDEEFKQCRMDLIRILEEQK